MQRMEVFISTYIVKKIHKFLIFIKDYLFKKPVNDVGTSCRNTRPGKNKIPVFIPMFIPIFIPVLIPALFPSCITYILIN